jgi:FKBP-type peptidyl-prolyl cis-trans isomerase FklB
MRCALVVALLVGLAAPAWGGEDLETDAQRLGYSVGYQVGGDFRRDGLPLDVERVIEGVRHALEGAEPRLSPQQMRESLIWLEEQSEAARQQSR